MSFDPNEKQSGFHSCSNKREWCGAFVAWSVRVWICISAARVHQCHKILGPLLEWGPMGTNIMGPPIWILGPPLYIHFGEATSSIWYRYPSGHVRWVNSSGFCVYTSHASWTERLGQVVSLTLGTHAQRGLQYLVCVSVTQYLTFHVIIIATNNTDCLSGGWRSKMGENLFIQVGVCSRDVTSYIHSVAIQPTKTRFSPHFVRKKKGNAFPGDSPNPNPPPKPFPLTGLVSM